MQTRKFGLLALVLGATMFGAACEDKNEVLVPTPDPVITLNIAPDGGSLTVGQTLPLVAIVTGTATQTATWTSSNSAVAEVNATTGVVTAKAVGVAVITAVSTVDATARDAVTITVTAGGGGAPPVVGQPTITVQSITQGGTTQPVDPGNVEDRVDVTLNVDIPQGVTATAVRVMLAVGANQQSGGTEVCRQSFSSTQTAVDAQSVPQIIVCSFNTAELNADGTPKFTNGIYTLRGEVVNGDAVLARAVVSPLVLDNEDVLVAEVRTERSAVATDGPNEGTVWRGGDVTVHIIPAIYSGTPNSLASLTVTLESSNNYIEDGTCDVTVSPAAAACGAGETSTQSAVKDDTGPGYTAVFAYDDLFGDDDGAGGIEDPEVTLDLRGLTTGGNAFVGDERFVFPLPTGSPAGARRPEINDDNPLRIDNMAPRVTLLDVTPARLGCDQANCYIGSEFEFDAGDDEFFAFVDFGVDSESATFDVGTEAQFDDGAGFVADVESGADTRLTESEVPNLLVRANVEDALDNTRQVYATTDETVATEDLGDADQLIGIDVTDPEITDVDSTTGAEDEGTDPFADETDETFVISFQDEAGTAGAGPAGFGDDPLVVSSVLLYNQDELTGTELEEGTDYTVVCAVDNCSLTLMDREDGGLDEGYLVATFSVVDAAFPGNESDAEAIIWLDDETAPVVAGVTSPSTITGNTTVTFSADMSDNVELGDILAAVGYGALGYYAHEAPRVINTYGVPLTDDASNQGFTFPNFVYSLETAAGGTPDGNATFASAVNLAVRDVAAVEQDQVCPAPGVDNASAGTCVTRENNTIQPNVDAGNDLDQFATIDPNLATFAITEASFDGDDEESTLVAEATGPQGTFANPFDRVNFYYMDASGRWVRIAGAVSVRAVDDDTQNIRRWIYTLVTDFEVTGEQIVAIGVEDGAGLVTDPVAGT